MRILLAEDDPGLLRHLSVALKAVGHDVTETANGMDALTFLIENSWDAAVLDINMPGLDGISVIQQARERGCKTPVLLSTARSEVSDKVAGLDAGGDDYLVKPYSTEELLARLRAMERRHKPTLDHVIRVADLEIDLIRRTAVRGGTQIVLTNREFALLEHSPTLRQDLSPEWTSWNASGIITSILLRTSSMFM